MRIRTTPIASLCAGLLLAVLATMQSANAQNINEPEVEKGQTKLETFSEFQSGFNRGAAGDLREFHNLNYIRGLTDFWQLKSFFVLERAAHEDMRIAQFSLENTFEIVRAKNFGGIGLAWFTSIAAALNDDATNVVQFGPIVRIGAGPTSLILNPSLEKSFGQNHEEGIAFTYGWQLKHEVRKGFWLGIEGFGKFPDITGAGGPEEHRIGPVLTLERELADKRTLTFETGVLFGLTEATPDRAAKFQVTYSY